MPAGADIIFQAPSKPKLDFLGLNYYSRLVLGGWFQMKGHENELLSDSKFPVHAAGLTEHLLDARCLNVCHLQYKTCHCRCSPCRTACALC